MRYIYEYVDVIQLFNSLVLVAWIPLPSVTNWQLYITASTWKKSCRNKKNIYIYILKK